MKHLYVHFPFCRRKCAYCALHSRSGADEAERAGYARGIAAEIRALPGLDELESVYFGGGSPGWCPLDEVFAALPRGIAEFTVELNPLDVGGDLLERFADAGVNRISLGVQSFDDATLAAMGRPHNAACAEAAFRAILDRFPNAGMDFIAGYPAPGGGLSRICPSIERALALGPAHLSIYTLIRESGTALDSAVRQGRVTLPDDDAALDDFASGAALAESAGLARYEISNFARPGMECRYNLAVWRGEDYLGIGPGAHSRIGLERHEVLPAGERKVTRLALAEDRRERAIFALRLAEGIDLAALGDAPFAGAWRKTLEFHRRTGLVEKLGSGRYRFTARGMEVCDSTLAELE